MDRKNLLKAGRRKYALNLISNHSRDSQFLMYIL